MGPGSIDGKTAYSRKAELYARYRWDYSPAALAVIFEQAQLDASALVVDLGAGTGILTRHFAGRAWRVAALEPDPLMARQAARILAGLPRCAVVTACAEDVPLPPGCASLVCAAQAVHWFDPLPARAEMRRVLRPGGWLALLRNYGADGEEQARAMKSLHAPEYGVNAAASATSPARAPESFYYEGGQYRRLTFPFCFRQDWQAFLGALLSASYMPDPDHPRFPALERAARAVFERFSRGGLIEVRGATELYLGQIESPH